MSSSDKVRLLSAIDDGSLSGLATQRPPSPPTTPTRRARPHHSTSATHRRSWSRHPTTLLFLGSVVVAAVIGAALYASSSPSPSSPSDDGVPSFPVVINTWPFTVATAAAWKVLSSNNGSSVHLDALVAGGRACQDAKCDGTVGWDGSPDSKGQVSLDAIIMDGTAMDAASVGFLTKVRDAIGVARAVMEHSAETLLVGEGANEFAAQMGFHEQSLVGNSSAKIYKDWVANKCQPNYYRNCVGDKSGCPPYAPLSSSAARKQIHSKPRFNPDVTTTNHDTLGMVVVDSQGHTAAGCTSNGANHKVHGRVGDAAVVGAGAYADSTVGGCAETGDGDTMMRFMPTFRAVELMRAGSTPEQAAQTALEAVGKVYPSFLGAMVCVSNEGVIGAAAWGWTFTYAYASAVTKGEVKTVKVPPFNVSPAPSPAS